MNNRVIVNGAKGRVGSLAVKAIEADAALILAAACDQGDNLRQTIRDTKAQVVVDLTTASVAYEMALTIIEAGVSPVIGTSGLLPEQIKNLQELCAAKKLGGMIAPNFSISAVLLMKYSKEIAKYMPDAEIIELHHDGKADSPSGTAILTAQRIAEGRLQKQHVERKHEVLTHARGAENAGVSIHAVRLPGLNAHQEVIFGGPGQTLSIKSDVINREAYMPGICLACREVTKLSELIYGLEGIL